MDLTVCICTRDRPRYVRDCLEGLRRQSVGRNRYAVIVVDSASRAECAEEITALATLHEARLIRVNRPGLSVARNAGAWGARTPFVAYIDDDAVPAPGWIAAILDALAHPGRLPALIGGRILPKWEAPLPPWWPVSLRGVLSIIEHQGEGEYRSLALPKGLEPYGANMVVHVLSLLAVGGFGSTVGRCGENLLSDEDVQLAWTLQDLGYSVRYDSRIVVHHQIQAGRLEPGWLLNRLYWQGASTVLTRRLLHQPQAVWRELPRRILVAAIFAPLAFVPGHSTVLLAARWRRAYAHGFVKAAFGWHRTRSADGEPAAKVAARPHSAGTEQRQTSPI